MERKTMISTEVISISNGEQKKKTSNLDDFRSNLISEKETELEWLQSRRKEYFEHLCLLKMNRGLFDAMGIESKHPTFAIPCETHLREASDRNLVEKKLSDSPDLVNNLKVLINLGDEVLPPQKYQEIEPLNGKVEVHQLGKLKGSKEIDIRRRLSKPSVIFTLQTPKPQADQAKDKRKTDIITWQMKVQAQPIYQSLRRSNKLITHDQWKTAYEEVRSTKVLNKIEDLKSRHMWSFRQLKAHNPPPRKKAHWDYLLEEMAWLQTDFKEERRWKIACAWQIAKWVMEWHLTNDKESLCVKRKPKSETFMDIDNPMVENSKEEVSGNNLIAKKSIPQISAGASTAAKSSLVSKPVKPMPFHYESLIYEIDDMFVLADETPTYGALDLKKDDVYTKEHVHRIVPVSKLLFKRLKVEDTKDMSTQSLVWDGKSRTWEKCHSGSISREAPVYPTSNSKFETPVINCLFSAKKSLKEIASPPVYQPPTELRFTSDPWEPDEDELLVSLFKQYGANWTLISEWINSGYGKRSSFECFERYSQLEKEDINKVQFSSISAGDTGVDMRSNITKKNMKLLSKRKAIRHFSNLDIIKKTCKKREPSQTPKSATEKQAPKKPITNSMDTSDAKYYSPLDLSLMKAAKDRQLIQDSYDRRHAELLQQQQQRGIFASRSMHNTGGVQGNRPQGSLSSPSKPNQSSLSLSPPSVDSSSPLQMSPKPRNTELSQPAIRPQILPQPQHSPLANQTMPSGSSLTGPSPHFSQLSPALAQKVQIAAQQQHQAQFAQQMHVLQRQMQNDAQTAAAYVALHSAKLHPNSMSSLSTIPSQLKMRQLGNKGSPSNPLLMRPTNTSPMTIRANMSPQARISGKYSLTTPLNRDHNQRPLSYLHQVPSVIPSNPNIQLPHHPNPTVSHQSPQVQHQSSPSAHSQSATNSSPSNNNNV